MNRNQKYLALDLEFNQPSGRLIQVGIAIASASDKFENYITKTWYLDPKEPISAYITTLTGITQSDISKYCTSHESIARELSALIKQHNTFINPVTWDGGDATMLLTEFSKNQVEFNHFGRRWIDTKTLHAMVMLAQGKNPAGGLSSCMGAFKLPFKGLAHRADIDAANTLEFFFKLISRQSTMEQIIRDAKVI